MISLSGNPGRDGDLGSTADLPPDDAERPETLDSLRSTVNNFADIKPPAYLPRGALLVSGPPPIVAPPFDHVPTVRRPPLPPPALDPRRVAALIAPPAISARPTVDQHPVVGPQAIAPEEFPEPEQETFVFFETDPIPADWTSCRIVTTDGGNRSLPLADPGELAKYGLRQIAFPDKAILPIESFAQDHPDVVALNIRAVVNAVIRRRPDVCAVFTSPPKKD